VFTTPRSLCQNVFLHGPNDIVKLGDFGVARVLQHTRDLAATQLGTPYFMSPEVWNGHEYGAKSDVWSLGCILYELLAFRVPFDGANIVELSRAVVQQQAPALPVRVTPTMRQLVTTLLSKKASGRPSAEQLCFHPIIEYHVNTLFSYTFHEDREHCGVDEDNLVDSAVQGQHELEELREIEVLAKKQKETERQRAEIRHLVQNAAGTHAEAQQPKRQAGVYDSNTAHQV
jgi:NIMA (never in mitosis gene a)-related kinase